MPTNDNEFFRSTVTDEWNTPRPLTGPEQEQAAAQQQFSRNRKRKARKAFGLAAPVAVVAVAAVISSAVHFCAVCGRSECNYFSTTPQEITQYLWQEELPTVEPEHSTAENRITYYDLAMGGTSSSGLLYPVDTGNSYVTFNFDNFLTNLGLKDKYILTCKSLASNKRHEQDFIIYGLIQNSPTATDTAALIALVYSPYGAQPTPDFFPTHITEQMNQSADFVAAPLDIPNLWVTACSFVPQISAQQIVDVVLNLDLLVFESTSQWTSIGSSLKMWNSPSLSLLQTSSRSFPLEYPWNYFVHDTNGSQHFARHTGATYDFSSTLSDAYYASLSIEFAPTDWNTVADEWNRLFREAPQFGHQALAADIPLQQVTVNEVVYTPYMQIVKDPDTGDYMRRKVYFVPDCQPTCRLLLDSPSSVAEALPADQLFAMSSQPPEQIITEILGDTWQDALGLFYPADSEATPELPTASPTPTGTPAPTASPAPTAQPSAVLTTNTTVEGQLTLTELPGLLDGYDHCSAFVNGYAWVTRDGQAGYLSLDGEFTPLYTVTDDAIEEIDIFKVPNLYRPDNEITGSRREEIAWATRHFACSDSSIVPYYANGLWGYSDLSGSILVEPIYSSLSPMGLVGIGERQALPGESDFWGARYDIISPDGSVIASSVEAWADPELGYYFVNTADDVYQSAFSLYNADGTLVMDNVPISWGNCPLPEFTCGEDGIVVDGVAYDRTGTPIGDSNGKDVVGLLGSRMIYRENNAYGILNFDGSPFISPSISIITDAAADGSFYIRQKNSGVIRRYDAQLQELSCPPLAYVTVGESYRDPESGDFLVPVTVADQDNRQIAQLEVDAHVSPVYCLSLILEQDDLLYVFHEDDPSIQIYQLTLTE